MLLDICFGTRSAWKILALFGETPGKALSRRNIQQFTKLGNKALSKALLLMERCDVLRTKKIGRTTYYTPNLANAFVTQAFELARLEREALNNLDPTTVNILREFVYELTNINFENIQRITLFGSRAKRTDHAGSDIDVAILMREQDPSDELLITATIDHIRKRFGTEIQPHYYTAEEKGPLLLEMKKDGVNLL